MIEQQVTTDIFETAMGWVAIAGIGTRHSAHFSTGTHS